MSNIIERIEEIFINEGFLRYSDKPRSKYYHTFYKLDYYFYKITQNNKTITIYYKNTPQGNENIFMSFPDNINDMEIKRNILHCVYDPSHRQERIIKKYIDIEDDFENEKKNDYIKYHHYYDRNGRVVTHKEFDVETMIEERLNRLEKDYEDKKKRYGPYNNVCVPIIIEMMEVCEVYGLFDKGSEYAELLIHTVKEIYGEKSNNYYQILYFKGIFLYHKHEYHKAMDVFLEAHEHLLENHLIVSGPSFDILTGICKCLFDMHEITDYLVYATLFHELTRNNKKFKEDRQMALSFYNHALLLNDADDEYVEKAIEEYEQIELEWSPDSAWINIYLNVITGQVDQAYDTLMDLYDFYSYQLGINNYQTLKCVHFLSLFLFRTGRKKDGIELEKYCANKFIQTQGKLSPYYADCLYRLGEFYSHDKKYDMGNQYLDEAYSLYHQIFPDGSRNTIRTLFLHVTNLQDSKDYDKEVEIRELLQENVNKYLGEDNIDALDFIPEYFYALERNNQIEEAISVGKDYIEKLKMSEADPIDKAIGFMKYSSILFNSERYQDALDIDLEAERLLDDCDEDFYYDNTYDYYETLTDVEVCIAKDLYLLERNKEAYERIKGIIEEIKDNPDWDDDFIDILKPLL